MHTLADRQDYADFLEVIPAFSCCTRTVLEEFVDHGAVKVRCGAGKTLSPQTQQDQNLYVLVAGSAVLKSDDDVAIALEPGDYFGTNPVHHHQLTASVVALSNVEVLVFNPQEVARLRQASSRDRHPSKIDWRLELLTPSRRTTHRDQRRHVLA